MFNRNIEPSCAYCIHSTDLGYNEYMCTKRGIMSAEGSCGKYVYEPTKRIPFKQPVLVETGYTEADFEL